MTALLKYNCPSINARDRRAIENVLKSGSLARGPMIGRFESALRDYTDARYANVLSSGTAALHLALLALGIGKGDEVITSPITFAASANCAVYVGARPRFIDIDEETCHLDLQKIKDYLRRPSVRRRVKAIIPVHFTGTVYDVAGLRAITDKYGIKVVEDAAHAIGARSRERGRWFSVGSCRHSDITVFSFHPIKNITAGEGGALLTNERKIAATVKRLRHNGISPSNGWRYDIPQIGYNYWLSDIHAALGISQLKRLDSFVKTRRRLAGIYNSAFADIPGITTPRERENTYSAYHLYVIRVGNGRRDYLYEYLRAQGIQTQVNYIPVYRFSAYRDLSRGQMRNCKNAERYFRECLSLPLHANLTAAQQESVVRAVKRFMAG